MPVHDDASTGRARDAAGPTRDAVDRALAAVVYSADDGALDTGASLLAAADRDEVARELLRRGEEFVRRAWERGWQPADVVRAVGRELEGTHALRLVSSLIASEVRRYARLDARWTAQLRELDAPRWAELGARDRFGHATVVLELFRVLLRLPAIEPVGPIPGQGGTGTPAPAVAARPDEPKALTRIRALLAKAEATDYPEEAEALTAKAQELMARHSVDEAQLAAHAGGAAAPGACRIGVDAPYETAKAILLDAVASANRCRAVWNEALGFSTVVGFEPDLDVVELLYTSLLVQGTSAMTRAEAAQRAGGRKRTKTFRQSFLLAYAHRIGDRLATTSDQVTAEAGASLLPVLAARDVAVTDRAEQMFPQTTTTRVRGATDHAGWQDGTAAADRAQVGPDRGRVTR